MVLIKTDLGSLGFDSDGAAITALHWGRAGTLAEGALAQVLRDDLDAYFAGRAQGFAVPIAPPGSAFQRRFYEALCAIPYGETRTYGDLAKELDVSAQAIGQACGANPLPILVPCHRVLAADGLGGYSGDGGIETKVALLRLEGAGGLLI